MNRCVLVVVVGWLAAWQSPSFADPPASDKELVEAWLKVSRQHAEDYTFHPVAAPNAKWTLLPQAVFRHSQPVRGDDIGAVWLWIDQDKRPAVIGSVFAFTHQGDTRTVAHELHSLASQPIEATWRGSARWRTKSSGLAWQPVPDAPPAEKTPLGRQRQVRDIARRFQAESIDHKGGRWELRLVPRPIYQFDIESPKEGLGGSLIVFSQGTDPELILAVEARRVNDEFHWHYAPATFSDYSLKLRLDDREVWSRSEWSSNRDGPYWCDAASQERLPDKSTRKESTP
ncbi:MAG: hypothetical protein FD138_4357 [Planctomycetota bacterium]|nr:MAG: hypothetical protein FD138_4357 [Planctomycetota bacterium]